MASRRLLRSSLLLDHNGRREAARELIRDLDLDAVACRGCRRRVTIMFLAVGPDHDPEGCRVGFDETS